MTHRVKFYGLSDLSTGLQVEQAAQVLEDFDFSRTSTVSLAGILELHNSLQFLENGVFPAASNESRRASLRALIGPAKGAIGRYFNSLDDTSLSGIDEELSYEFHDDLLALLAKYKVYDRITPTEVLAFLDKLGAQLGDLLTSQDLVKACDTQLRDRILDRVAAAELVIRTYFEGDQRKTLYLPASFTSDDARSVIDQYIGSQEANLNFVKLVQNAPVNARTGVTAKIKLKAKQRYERDVAEHFEVHESMRSSYRMAIVEGQDEPAGLIQEGNEVSFTYSLSWLEDNLDFPTILNNFLYLFEFVDGQMLLTLPSFSSDLGVLERVMGIPGVRDYRTGVAFRFRRDISTMQMVMYSQFLQEKGIELETVAAWFFDTYLKEQFGADHFHFRPSTSGSTYLERCRHLFAEMESISKQYRLYVEDGELDTELLGISSEQVRYNELPSLLKKKYVYANSEDADVQQILHLLYSDQSPIRYVSDTLQASCAAELLLEDVVSYDDLHEYQHQYFDYLIDKGVLAREDQRIVFVDLYQHIVLKSLFKVEAVSYYHYPPDARAVIDDMADRDWLTSQATLLSRAEASYFNFTLNQFEFSNGPDLRNRYLHASHADSDDEDEHFRTYLVALKLIISLVIKICDDLWLFKDEQDGPSTS